MCALRIIIPLLLTFLSLSEIQAQTKTQAGQIKEFVFFMDNIFTLNSAAL